MALRPIQKLMLVTNLIWIVTLSAAYGYAQMFSRPVKDATVQRPAELVISEIYGSLLFISALLLAISLQHPLAWWVGVLTITPGLVSLMRSGAMRNWSTLGKWFLVPLPLALFVSARDMSFYDTALYHQQAVKWLSSFGLVPGLALLHFRLGFTSSWFALAAPINSGMLSGRAPSILGGLVSVLILAAFGSAIVTSRSRKAPTERALAWAVHCGCVLAIAGAWNIEASLSPDIVVWLLPLVVATLLTDETAPAVDRAGKAMFLAALGCLVKPTALPILGYTTAIFGLALRKGIGRRYVGWLAATVLAGVLLIGANLRASGCPFFPSPLGCTSLNWSVGASTARGVQSVIAEYTRARGLLNTEILPLSLLAAGGTVAALRTRRSDPFVRHALAVSWIGIATVLSQALNTRFALGYFLLPVATGVASLRWTTILTPLKEFVARFRLVALNRNAVGIGLWAVTWGVAAFHIANAQDLLYPRRMAGLTGDPIHLRNRKLDANTILSLHQEPRVGMALWKPADSDQCWDADLPCTPSLTIETVKLRDSGEGLAGGFVRE